MWCVADIHNCMCHIMCKRVSDSNFNQAVMAKYQFFTKLPQISYIHKSPNFYSIIGIFRPTASALKILWQEDVRNVLFHFCQL